MANDKSTSKGKPEQTTGTAIGAAMEAATVVTTANPAKPTMPEPVFKLVANPRAFQDKSDASKSTVRIAHVGLRSGVFHLEASIYLETKVEQRADGRHEAKALRFSLPKGVELFDGLDSSHVGAWKDSVLDAFIAWREQTGESVAAIRSQPGVRALPASLSVPTTTPAQ